MIIYRYLFPWISKLNFFKHESLILNPSRSSFIRCKFNIPLVCCFQAFTPLGQYMKTFCSVKKCVYMKIDYKFIYGSLNQKMMLKFFVNNEPNMAMIDLYTIYA